MIRHGFLEGKTLVLFTQQFRHPAGHTVDMMTRTQINAKAYMLLTFSKRVSLSPIVLIHYLKFEGNFCACVFGKGVRCLAQAAMDLYSFCVNAEVRTIFKTYSYN